MELRESRRLDPDGFLRKTYTLPVDDARAKAREFLREYPAGDTLRSLSIGANCPMGKFNSRCAGYRLRINQGAKTCFKQRSLTDDTRAAQGVR